MLTIWRAALTTAWGLRGANPRRGTGFALSIPMKTLASAFALVALALVSSPALANGEGAQVPEASAMTLFALGVLGILVGRRGAMRSKDKDGE